MDDTSPIYLQTDASEYGIGAYLYQIVNDPDTGKKVEHPVGFISKAIHIAHASWGIPMKEGYAIFYALQEWEYLLRDRKFTILTDHENLTRLRDEGQANKMVRRWFQTYQEFDTVLEWKKGSENQVPDDFSRLCANDQADYAQQAISLFHLTGYGIDNSDFKYFEAGKFDGDTTGRNDDLFLTEVADLQETVAHKSVVLSQLTGYEIPKENWDIIAKYHNAIAGHGGLERTCKRLTDNGHIWPHREKHVKRFIKMCPCCQKMNDIKRVVHTYPFTLSTYGLWQEVSIDYIESLKPDKFGNNMIIVMIDNFSRFVELYPTNSTNAEGAADAVIQFCGRYGTPSKFRTDGGAAFKGKIFQGLVTRLGADSELATAYSKEENGIVERINKEVLRHLKAIIFDKRVALTWSKYLAIVQRIINTSVHSATGLTPAEIAFPSGARLDKSLIIDSNTEISMSLYMQDLEETHHHIVSIAEENLKET